MKIERLYSNYQEEERLYSTGNDELDELMERAFCEGYEYAQREFGKVGDWFKGETFGDFDRYTTRARRMREKYAAKNPEKYANMSLAERAELAARNIKRAKRINMAGKAAMIALPTAAAIGTGVAIKKHRDKKKKEQE